MKRWIRLALLLLMTFAAGFAAALPLCSRQINATQEMFMASMAGLQRRIYGSNSFHREANAGLTALDPAKGGSITLSYIGGMDGHIGGSDLHLQLRSDGNLYYRNRSQTELVTTLSPEQCTAVFRRFLGSGILNYSDAVIDLKKDLFPSGGGGRATDNPTTIIRIVVPEANIEKTVSVYIPRSELEEFPAIIEFRIVTELEKELTNLVPKEFPLWK